MYNALQTDSISITFSTAEEACENEVHENNVTLRSGFKLVSCKQNSLQP